MLGPFPAGAKWPSFRQLPRQRVAVSGRKASESADQADRSINRTPELLRPPFGHIPLHLIEGQIEGTLSDLKLASLQLQHWKSLALESSPDTQEPDPPLGNFKEITSTC